MKSDGPSMHLRLLLPFAQGQPLLLANLISLFLSLSLSLRKEMACLKHVYHLLAILCTSTPRPFWFVSSYHIRTYTGIICLFV